MLGRPALPSRYILDDSPVPLYSDYNREKSSRESPVRTNTSAEKSDGPSILAGRLWPGPARCDVRTLLATLARVAKFVCKKTFAIYGVGKRRAELAINYSRYF